MSFLGIDLGTSSVKLLLLDKEQGILQTVSKEYPVFYPRPGWAEQKPEDWWNAVRDGIRELLNKLGISAGQVAAVGFSGQMHGLVLLDGQQQVLAPALLWCDQRTQVECDELAEKLGSRLVEYTGNQALTGFTAPKVLWMKKHRPDIFRAIRHVLLPKDYIRWQLTGDFATDVSDASGTLFFDVAKRQWSAEMLAFLGLPAAVVPACYESCTVTGYITRQAAAETGLPAGIPVVGGGGDQASGAIGTGIVRTGGISVALGTSGVVFACQETYSVDKENRLHAFCHANGKWHVMGVMLAAAACLKWWVNEACKLEEAGFDLLLREAQQIPAGSEGLIFLPYLLGERSPYSDPNARGAFIGLTVKHGRGHMTRAVLEGVAMGLRDLLEIAKEQQLPIQEIRVNGGGAKSALWRQILADVLGHPVCMVNSVEGPALGAAIMAAVGNGAYASLEAACDAIVKVVETKVPVPANMDTYNDLYTVYHQLYHRLRETFDGLSHV